MIGQIVAGRLRSVPRTIAKKYSIPFISNTIFKQIGFRRRFRVFDVGNGFHIFLSKSQRKGCDPFTHVHPLKISFPPLLHIFFSLPLLFLSSAFFHGRETMLKDESRSKPFAVLALVNCTLHLRALPLRSACTKYAFRAGTRSRGKLFPTPRNTWSAVC